MPNTVSITAPAAGTTIPPSQVFSGTFTLSNGVYERIRCVLTYPVTSGNDPLVREMDATPNAGAGTWTATFAGLDPGLDANFEVEFYVTVNNRVDTDAIEDLDIIPMFAANPVGTITTVALHRGRP